MPYCSVQGRFRKWSLRHFELRRQPLHLEEGPQDTVEGNRFVVNLKYRPDRAKPNLAQPIQKPSAVETNASMRGETLASASVTAAQIPCTRPLATRPRNW